MQCLRLLCQFPDDLPITNFGFGDGKIFEILGSIFQSASIIFVSE
jgi:hypothetical protein